MSKKRLSALFFVIIFCYYVIFSYLCSVQNKLKLFYMKKIYILSAILCAMTFMPVEVSAKTAAEPIMNYMPDDTNIRIEMENRAVSVYGAQNMILEIVSVTGKPIQKIKIESTSQRIELNLPKGCYILKVGSVVRKVFIR